MFVIDEAPLREPLKTRISETVPEINDNAYADPGVGDVKCRIGVGPEMEVEKIHDMAANQTVQKIAEDSAAQ